MIVFASIAWLVFLGVLVIAMAITENRNKRNKP